MGHYYHQLKGQPKDAIQALSAFARGGRTRKFDVSVRAFDYYC